MARPRKIGAYRGVLVGVVATLIVAALELAGAFRDFELWLLDKRFIYCNRLPPSKTIVHIDITDDSIDRIGRWPWHRRHHADLVRTLAELGAKYTVFDIEFSEPTDPRLPGGDDDPSMLYSAADLIHDDDELAAAIREAGNVFLPISFELQARGRDEAAQQQKAGELLRVNPDIDGRAFAEALGVPAEEGPGLLTRSRLARALREEFGLKTLELARRLEMAPDEVDRYLAGVKRDVARELAAAHLRQVSCDALPELAAAPGPERERFLQSVLGEPAGRAALDVDDLVRAFGRELSARLALCACEKAPAGPSRLPVASGVTPPWYPFASAAAGFGFVAFDADGDGVVRRTPLYVRYRDRLILQLGYAVARPLADSDVARRHVPLDSDGKCLIVWQTAPPRWNSEVNNFRHIQVGRVLEIPMARRQMLSNKAVLGETWAELVAEFAGQGENAHYRELVRERNRLLRANPNADVAHLEKEIGEIERKLVAYFQQVWPPPEPLTPRDEAEREQFARYDRLHEALVLGKLAQQVNEANARLQVQVEKRLSELRPLVADRVCLVGYTATAVADMKPTAIFPLAPGVVVHSNVINQTLAGRSIRPAKRWEGVALLVVVGLGIAVVTALLGPYLSLLAMVGLQAVGALVNGFVLFAWLGVWVAAAGPMVAVGSAWAAVTLYRQLTEERKKRQFASALSQYVSHAVARRIADDIYDLSPIAGDVTCFFSDLKGFTSISERLGPAGTRDLLNPYLEAMSDVLQRHGALINKFIGDGIFAFFNPPIWPCADHAAAACRSALACLEALQRLNQRLATEGKDAGLLSMRVGISTGPVFVGDYGSDTKRDYTCIGDTVNLGARLEAANKAFGSKIMVAESTHRLVEGQFEFRFLGRLQVVGKTEVIGVYELLGAAGSLPQERLDAARRFESALEAFRLRNWDAAEEALKAYSASCPEDPGAARYLELVSKYRQSPPPGDWNGAVVLTEK